jgi:pimeloyl-ACP methyl ester carboxylesterase
MAKVVLVHGAWHGAWCWDGVVAQLDQLGVPYEAVQLPHTGFADDVAAARAAIASAGDGSVVIGHSYGGAVISEAASGIDGLNRLVYLAAFMLDVDDDQGAVMVNHQSPILACVGPVDGGVAVDPAKAHELFYADSDEQVVADVIPRLRPMGVGGGAGPASEPAWKTVPSTYIICTEDGALPPSAQREMAAHADAVAEWPTDHSPFLTRPRDIAELLASYL